MKKLITLICIIGVVSMCGCGSKTVKETVKTDETQSDIISSQDNMNADCATVINECSKDIDGDGEDDKIILSTSAERSGGKMIWDDSQDWCVYASIGDKYYELYNNKVSVGSVFYNVFENEEEKTVISVTVQSSSEYSVSEYLYTDSGFEKQVKINEDNINLISSSVPDYE